jgi:hypothetical protein
MRGDKDTLLALALPRLIRLRVLFLSLSFPRSLSPLPHHRATVPPVLAPSKLALALGTFKPTHHSFL